MALVTQPISLSSYSYSCDSTKGLSKRAPNSEAMSWAEFRKCMEAGMTYEQVNAIKPMKRCEYDKRVKAGGYQPEHVRKQAQKVKSICEMYDNGASIEEIAKAHNLTENYCKHILSDNDRPCTAISLLLRQKDKIQTMADKNYTKKTMAKKLGTTPATIAEVLEILGIRTLKERLIELAESYTRSTFTADLKKYGNIKAMSKATGISIAKLTDCAKTLNVVI